MGKEGKEMNKDRYEELKGVYYKLENWRGEFSDVLGDEREALYNTPENLQGTKKHEREEYALDCLCDVRQIVDTALQLLRQALRSYR